MEASALTHAQRGLNARTRAGNPATRVKDSSGTKARKVLFVCQESGCARGQRVIYCVVARAYFALLHSAPPAHDHYRGEKRDGCCEACR